MKLNPYPLLLAGALALLVSLPARAHVSFAEPGATAGSWYKGALRVTHGCKGSATHTVTVQIPKGVVAARPMPKPGWTIATRLAKLDQPFELHGRRITETVAEITWSGGRLENAHFDEFSILMRLPDRAGKLHFLVSQICDQGRHDWVQVPPPGKTVHDLEAPAAELELIPAWTGAGSSGHAH